MICLFCASVSRRAHLNILLLHSLPSFLFHPSRLLLGLGCESSLQNLPVTIQQCVSCNYLFRTQCFSDCAVQPREGLTVSHTVLHCSFHCQSLWILLYCVGYFSSGCANSTCLLVLALSVSRTVFSRQWPCVFTSTVLALCPVDRVEDKAAEDFTLFVDKTCFET